jgi:AcrR family transcriptional regulator
LTFKHLFETVISNMSSKLKDAASPHAATREALVDAAAEVFAQRGFAGTTVREICERAGANIAAVNYHFGDKERLYAEVLTHALRCAREKFPPTLGLPPGAKPDEQLRAFVESLLRRIFDEGRHSWHGRLMAREMVEPTAALDQLVEEEIRPMSDRLHQIVRQMLGARADANTVHQCAMSVVSQCVFYQHCRPVLIRLFPGRKFGPQAIREIAGHITGFSIAAIRQAAAAATSRRRR